MSLHDKGRSCEQTEEVLDNYRRRAIRAERALIACRAAMSAQDESTAALAAAEDLARLAMVDAAEQVASVLAGLHAEIDRLRAIVDATAPEVGR